MRWILIIAVLVLTACQPDPTPFPVNIPVTESASAQAPVSVTPGTIRYALAANTIDAIPDIALIMESSQVEYLSQPVNPADLGARYDIIVTYGNVPDGVVSPVTVHVALILNTGRSFFEGIQLPSLLNRSLDPRTVVNMLGIPGSIPDQADTVDAGAIRGELANAGFPDGLIVNIVSAYSPGVSAIKAVFQAAGVESQWALASPQSISEVFQSGDVLAALVTWTTSESRAVWESVSDPENVIDLFTIPISYLAVDGLTITFTSSGFPLATR